MSICIYYTERWEVVFCYWFALCFTGTKVHNQLPAGILKKMSFVHSRFYFKCIEKPNEINLCYQHHKKRTSKTWNLEVKLMNDVMEEEGGMYN